jgi:hypothetical protein
MVAASNQSGLGPLTSLRSSPVMIKDEDEGLAALGGKTRLVSRKLPSLPSSPNDSSNGTPSPKSSPVQRYSIDQGHVTLEPTSIHIHGVTDQTNQWQYTQAQEGGYGPYYPSASSNHSWSSEAEYPRPPSHSPSLIMHPAPFQSYEQFPSIGHPYMPSHSPLDSHMPPDVNASWQSLYAQYDQPSME